MKTSGFHGRYASAIASLRSSRLFIHSLLAILVASAATVRGADDDGGRPLDTGANRAAAPLEGQADRRAERIEVETDGVRRVVEGIVVV